MIYRLNPTPLCLGVGRIGGTPQVQGRRRRGLLERQAEKLRRITQQEEIEIALPHGAKRGVNKFDIWSQAALEQV